MISFVYAWLSEEEQEMTGELTLNSAIHVPF